MQRESIFFVPGWFFPKKRNGLLEILTGHQVSRCGVVIRISDGKIAGHFGRQRDKFVHYSIF